MYVKITYVAIYIDNMMYVLLLLAYIQTVLLITIQYNTMISFLSSSVVDCIHSLITCTYSTTYLFLCPVVIPVLNARLSVMLLWPTKLDKYTLRYNIMGSQ